jgi:hypothetical protein
VERSTPRATGTPMTVAEFCDYRDQNQALRALAGFANWSGCSPRAWLPWRDRPSDSCPRCAPAAST